MEIRTGDLILRTAGPEDIGEISRMWDFEKGPISRDEAVKCGRDGTLGEELHIFYSIEPDYRGRGYAFQAARAVLGYAFTKAGAPFVNGGCDKDNRASYRVMEKAGMRRAGENENGDPIFYLSKETYLDDIKIAGAAGLQDLPR